MDNLAENFLATTPSNGVWVESWYDDMVDTWLPRLQKFLAELVEEQVQDVRKFLSEPIKNEAIYPALEGRGPIPSVAALRKQFAIDDSL